MLAIGGLFRHIIDSTTLLCPQEGFFMNDIDSLTFNDQY